jgi:hypothetical protein
MYPADEIAPLGLLGETFPIFFLIKQREKALNQIKKTACQ